MKTPPGMLVPMPVTFNKKVLLTPLRQLPVTIHREALNRLGNRVVSNPVLSSAVPGVIRHLHTKWALLRLVGPTDW